MVQCQCLKSDKTQCQRQSSIKSGDNPNYCWQHQKCKSGNKQEISPHKEPQPQKIKTPTKPKSPEKSAVPKTINEKYWKHLPDQVISELAKLAEGCPPDQFKSPKTGKCVIIYGLTGKTIINELYMLIKKESAKNTKLMVRKKPLTKSELPKQVIVQDGEEFYPDIDWEKPHLATATWKDKLFYSDRSGVVIDDISEGGHFDPQTGIYSRYAGSEHVFRILEKVTM